MLKQILQISSLALMLAASVALPAYAASEEDAAAPAGSFTSDMAVPAAPVQMAMHVQAHHARM